MTIGNPRYGRFTIIKANKGLLLKVTFIFALACFASSSLRGKQTSSSSDPARRSHDHVHQELTPGSLFPDARSIAVQPLTEDDDVCLTPELNGSWVLEQNKTFADPLCCDGDDKLYRYSPKQCGHERPQGDFNGQPDILAYMRGRGCRCGSFFTDRYTWKAAVLSDWDAHDFCQRLGTRRLLLVGDSTMSQSATTLMNAVHPAGCQTQMAFMLADTLILEELGFMNRGLYWTDAIMKQNPDIVVLSSGPHIYGDANYARLHDTVLADIAVLRRATNITFVWKTQQAAGCTAEMPTMLHPFEAARHLPQVADLEYNHEEFFRRDSQSIRRMQKHNVAFADLRMLYSRSDAHMMVDRDCLHFCSPGPLEIFPVVLHRLLKTNFAVSSCIQKTHL